MESLIYSALLAIFLGLAFMVTAQMLENANKVRIKLEVSEEAEFILKKIEWAVTGAATTTLPSANSTGTVLVISKANFPDNPLEFSLVSGIVYLKRGAATSTRLNNDRVSVSELLFDHRRDDTNGQSIILVTLTAKNKKVGDGEIFEASTTLKTAYKI
ncbi:MAG: hypothetical protein HYT12_01380 [Candidatus Liptonbacteria bacterium]|nr:hypothetical protein [Candidatus Liptonbacteria bacterium]